MHNKSVCSRGVIQGLDVRFHLLVSPEPYHRFMIPNMGCMPSGGGGGGGGEFDYWRGGGAIQVILYISVLYYIFI